MSENCPHKTIVLDCSGSLCKEYCADCRKILNECKHIRTELLTSDAELYFDRRRRCLDCGLILENFIPNCS